MVISATVQRVPTAGPPREDSSPGARRVSSRRVSLPRVSLPGVSSPGVSSPRVAVVLDGSAAAHGVAAGLAHAGGYRVREYTGTQEFLAGLRTRLVSRPDVLVMGARAPVGWGAGAPTLADVIQSVATFGCFPPPSQAPSAEHREPLPGPAGWAAHPDPERVLTVREREVLQSISTGLTHKQIARTMGLSKTTVDTYVQRIRQKLGVGNKAELTRAAYRFGLCGDD